MPRPSEPLLTFLRDTVRRKGYSTAELAERTGIERAALKRRLGGSEPLTVDDLVLLSQALELSPAEIGLGGQEAPEVHPLPGANLVAAPDPLGNLGEQVLRLGFALGVDLFLVLDSKRLGESGVPKTVLGRFPDSLPIRLEAKYHRHNKPRFEADHFECVLSFDALYTCTFPWTAFRQVTFTLPEEAPAPPAPPPPEPEPPPRDDGTAPGRAPFLRVVK